MNLIKPLHPAKTIGIIGGGQLGRMMALSAKAMGFKVGVLDPLANCPTAQVADWQIVSDYDDHQAIASLFTRADVITYEFENVDADSLDAAKMNVKDKLPQGTDLLRITQERLNEKAFLTSLAIPVASYEKIGNEEDLTAAVQKIAYPCVLKTNRGGYDGKGQYVLRSAADLPAASQLLEFGSCVLEEWVSYMQEVSILVAGNGQTYITYPLVENRHRDNILHQTIAPAALSQNLTDQAKQMAVDIAHSIHLRGILAIELFVTPQGLLVNELAPRPHNSGHYTIEACDFSQFDTHIRGIAGWPLAQPRLGQSAIMVNILGEQLEASYQLINQKAQWHFHYYGKEEAKLGRKMGHITVLTESIERSLDEIKQTKVWDED